MFDSEFDLKLDLPENTKTHPWRICPKGNIM
jgi:hypothetical protein